MKVCILGDNLTSLALAKALVKKEIFVDLFYKKKNNNDPKCMSRYTLKFSCKQYISKNEF